jgi:hypothetical protein
MVRFLDWLTAWYALNCVLAGWRTNKSQKMNGEQVNEQGMIQTVSIHAIIELIFALHPDN